METIITSIDKNGIIKRIIYNNSIILLNRDDKISLNVKDPANQIDIKLNFEFSDFGKENTTTATLSEDGNTINMILHQWDSAMGIELTKPLEYIADATGKKLWVKFRTTSDKKNSWRSFHITIWIEQ